MDREKQIVTIALIECPATQINDLVTGGLLGDHRSIRLVIETLIALFGHVDQTGCSCQSDFDAVRGEVIQGFFLGCAHSRGLVGMNGQAFSGRRN